MPGWGDARRRNPERSNAVRDIPTRGSTAEKGSSLKRKCRNR
jgi:hypothetical protein